MPSQNPEVILILTQPEARVLRRYTTKDAHRWTATDERLFKAATTKLEAAIARTEGAAKITTARAERRGFGRTG
jgi:hypothetical protein